MQRSCYLKITDIAAIVQDDDNVSATTGDDNNVYMGDDEDFAAIADDDDNIIATAGGVHDFATIVEDDCDEFCRD